MRDTIRVLCVDDHELLSEGLAGRMAIEKDLECVGRLTTADTLVEEAQRLQPNVVLLDLEMPGRDPLESITDLRKSCPNTRVIILTAYLRDHLLDQAVQRGASGYFMKTDPPNEILDGIRHVAKGEMAFGSGVQERLDIIGSGSSAVSSRLQSLTPREMEVLRLIGLGLSRADIARRLYRSLKTIDAHHTSIMRKLDIHDRAELTRYVIQEGLAAV
jgi:DNA-binding NarL/FixJ family response regulator